MGIIFVHPKRFEMKAAILVTAIVIFTFAAATNANKKGGGRGRNRDPTDIIPPCAMVDKIWVGGEVTKVWPGARTAEECGKACDRSPICMYWTIYLRRRGDDETIYNPNDCIARYENNGTKEQKGTFSGKKSCWYQDSSLSTHKLIGEVLTSPVSYFTFLQSVIHASIISMTFTKEIRLFHSPVTPHFTTEIHFRAFVNLGVMSEQFI